MLNSEFVTILGKSKALSGKECSLQHHPVVNPKMLVKFAVFATLQKNTSACSKSSCGGIG